jgi:dipeptidyl aminopeptidase/acylaminoacyl peptidase
MHGTKDENVPIAQSQELFDKLQAAGVPSQFVKVDDVHTFQTPEARHQLTTDSFAFFVRYLAVAP